MNPVDSPLVTDPAHTQDINPPEARKEDILTDVFVPAAEPSMVVHIEHINEEAAANPAPTPSSAAQASTGEMYDHPQFCPVPKKTYSSHFKKIREMLETPGAFRNSVSFKIREICNYMHRITQLLLGSEEFSNADLRYVTDMSICIVQWLKSWYLECRVQVDKWEYVWNHFPKFPTFINYCDDYPGLDARTICLYYRHNLPTAYWQYHEEYTVFREMSFFASEQMWNPYAIKARLHPNHRRNKAHRPVRNVVDDLDSIRQLFWRRVSLMDAVKKDYHDCIDLYRSVPYKFKLKLLKHLEDLGIAEASGTPESPRILVPSASPPEEPLPEASEGDPKGKKKAIPAPVKFEEVDYYALDREERKRAEHGGPCPGEELSKYHKSFEEEKFKLEYTERKARRQGKRRQAESIGSSKHEEAAHQTLPREREQNRVTAWLKQIAGAEDPWPSFSDNPASNKSLLSRLRFPLIGAACRPGAGEDIVSDQASSSHTLSPATSSAPLASPLRRMVSAPPMSLRDVERAVDEVSRSRESRQRTGLTRLLCGVPTSAGKDKDGEKAEQGDTHEGRKLDVDEKGQLQARYHRKHTI